MTRLCRELGPWALFSLSLVLLLPAVVAVAAVGSVDHWWTVVVGELTAGRHHRLLLTSFLYAGIAALLAMVLGLPIALGLARSRLIGARWLRFVSFLPLAVPGYVMVAAWVESLAWVSGARLSAYNLPFAAWVTALQLFPLVTWAVISGATTFSTEAEEEALTETSALGVVVRVTLPMLAPATAAGAILVFLLAFTQFEIPDLLSVRTYPVEIFAEFSSSYDVGRAALLSFPQLIVCLAVLVAESRMIYRLELTTADTAEPFVLLNSAHCRAALSVWSWATILLALLVPLLSLLRRAGTGHVCATVLKANTCQLGNTFLVAGVSAVVGTLIALGPAYLAARGRGVVRHGVRLVSLLPIAIPGSIFGVGLIRLANRPLLESWLYSTTAVVVLGVAARAMPFAVKLLESGFVAAGAATEETALVDGASWRTRLSKVLGTSLVPSLTAAFFVVYILAAGEVAVTVLVRPPGGDTLSVTAFSLMHYGHTPEVAALCLLQLLTVATGLAAWGAGKVGLKWIG